MNETRRVLLLGATGSIGRATAAALVARGHDPVCFVRPAGTGGDGHGGRRGIPEGCEIRWGTPDSADAVAKTAIRGERFDAVVSCMASRTGAPADAWAVDHDANLHVLRAAEASGIEHFVLLSAICVQRPRLEFQRAKLAFESELRASSIGWSIVRPTAFFKSISGQVPRVAAGKPYLLLGDGRRTACKPIADEDLADFLCDCVENPSMRERILPVGGPGPALTPRDQGELLFEVAGRTPSFRSLPMPLFSALVGALSLAARVVPALRDRTELARIGHYYATESMLVWDDETGRYDADATPEYGSRRLADYYARLLRGELADERGDHAVL